MSSKYPVHADKSLEVAVYSATTIHSFVYGCARESVIWVLKPWLFSCLDLNPPNWPFRVLRPAFAYCCFIWQAAWCNPKLVGVLVTASRLFHCYDDIMLVTASRLFHVDEECYDDISKVENTVIQHIQVAVYL